MASMIERVAATEAEAAQIVREATERARAAVAEAERDAQEAAAKARENAREMLRKSAEADRLECSGSVRKALRRQRLLARQRGRASRMRRHLFSAR